MDLPAFVFLTFRMFPVLKTLPSTPQTSNWTLEYRSRQAERRVLPLEV